MQHHPTHLCDQEPIQYPGKIQPHGALLVIDRLTLQVIQVSANIHEYLPGSSATLLGRPLSEVLQVVNYNPAFQHGEYQVIQSPHKGNCYLIAHFTKAFLLLEIEPVQEYDYNPEEIMSRVLTAVLGSETVLDTLQEAARKVKLVTGFNRVMVYMFHEDGHGEVIAEEADPEFAPYLGLHYPASDIPKQARELYKKNLVRLIADVNAPDCKLKGLATMQPATTVDLSDAVLRAVSPIHIQYLQNMGVAASFSVSILSQGELWGLIACHHYQPKTLDYRQRLHAKMIGQLVSSSVRFQTEEEKQLLHHSWRGNTAILARQMRQETGIVAGLSENNVNLLSINSATGAVLVYENQVTLIGDTPDLIFIRELAAFLQKTATKQIFHTHYLTEVFPAASDYADKASGILCAFLSAEREEFIIWFKPEKEQEIKWAGNPEKAVVINAVGDVKIEPRTSFAVLVQSLKHRSEPWTLTELSNAANLREELLLVIQEKISQLKTLNEELKKAYEELDSFSYTISHDLKTPLATIYNFADLLLEEDPALDNRLLTEKIKRNAERMQQMIKDVFRYTRLGREPISIQPIDMHVLLNQIREDLLDAYAEAQPELEIGDTPIVYGDSTMITQVFSNLMGNAVKYSSKKEKPRIQILGSADADTVTYSIIDNGIGMDEKHTAKLFHLFYRLPDARSFEGTGIGLAIVKRIIDKHQGELWFETEQNQGTRFYIKLKNQPKD